MSSDDTGRLLIRLPSIYGETLSAILMDQFFTSAPDEEYSNEVETKADKTGGTCKSWNLLNRGHYLGDAIENPQTGQYQYNCPDDLGLIHLFIGHRST